MSATRNEDPVLGRIDRDSSQFMSRMRPRVSTNGRVAEMIELAALLTNHPNTDATAALARIATELLESGADATIDQAIEAAPSGGIAQTLRHAAEAASERVVIARNGATTELSLFAIPIVAAFEQSVPATQFEAALSAANGSNDLVNVARDSQAMLIPKRFRLEELMAAPLSVVRKAGLRLGTAAVSRGGNGFPFVTQVGSFKRSTAFVHCIVGQRQLFQHRDWSVAEGGLCERLQDLTKEAVKRYLGLPCQVQASYTGSFHEALYTGMWLYQEKRLDQLARTSRAEAGTGKNMEARVVTHGCRLRFEMRVGFFAGDEAIGGHAYRLTSRPSEDPSRSVSRITRRLEVAGIRTNALADFVPEERGFDLPGGRKVETLMITLPI